MACQRLHNSSQFILLNLGLGILLIKYEASIG